MRWFGHRVERSLAVRFEKMNVAQGVPRGGDLSIPYIAFVSSIHAYLGPRIHCLTTPPTFIKRMEKLELKL